MDYRPRIWEKYATNVMKQSEPISPESADAWGRPYDHYLRGWLPADKSAAIVDVACGYGQLLRYFTVRGYQNVTGVDISPEQVRLASKIHSNVVQANVLEYLESHRASYDLITGLDIVEHFRKDEVLRFLDGCFGALRPGGRIILQTPNAETPWGLTHRYNDFTHEVGFNPNALSWVLRLCGFDGIESREQGPRPHGLKSTVRFVLWKFIRLQLAAYNLIETGAVGSGVFTRVFIASGVRS